MIEPRKARSVAEFIEHVQKIRELPGWFPKKDNWEPWFRGQQDASWSLKPKLYRGRSDWQGVGYASKCART